MLVILITFVMLICLSYHDLSSFNSKPRRSIVRINCCINPVKFILKFNFVRTGQLCSISRRCLIQSFFVPPKRRVNKILTVAINLFELSNFTNTCFCKECTGIFFHSRFHRRQPILQRLLVQAFSCKKFVKIGDKNYQ